MESLFALLQKLEAGAAGEWERRAASELCYGYRVSRQKGGRWDSLLREAADAFRKTEGTAAERCGAMERMLSPMAEDCKGYTLLLCSHSHIDLNFQWGYDETVSIVLATFRTMLTLLKEYPEFIYSQSQAAAYELAARYEPELIEGIRRYVKEGRWEVTASTWVEADKNMPSGESFAHQTMAAKAYLSELLGISPESMQVDFEPDTFGHNENLPEILQNSGVNYYYFCRGEGNTNNLFLWEAPGGSRVLAYKEPHWYDSRIQPDMAYTVPELCEKNRIDRIMKVYGVGDHGGGPTRRDLERALDMMEWPIFPRIQFGRYQDYFRYADGFRDGFPVVKGELHSIFTGCLTSQSEIKKGNRKCELLLGQAETLAALAGRRDSALLEEGWKKLLFNQFHDILPGSCVPQVVHFALGRDQEVLAAANASRVHSLTALAEQIDTTGFPAGECVSRDELYSWGAGAGIFVQDSLRAGLPEQGRGKRRVFHLFNTTAFDREDVTEVLLWDWYGNTDAISVRNPEGKPVEWQLVNKGFKEEWGHFFLRLLVRAAVPAFGYTTLLLEERDDYQLEDTDRMASDLILVAENLPPKEEQKDPVLENERIRFVFDRHDLTVREVLDKNTGEVFRGEMGLFQLIEEDPATGGSAWVIGREMNRTELRQFRLTQTSVGDSLLRQSLTFEGSFSHSGIRVTVFLDRGSTHLEYDVTCDWHEYARTPDNSFGMKVSPVRQLACGFAPGYRGERFLFDRPFGTVLRAPKDMDVCGSTFALAERPLDENGADMAGMMIASDCKYGYRCTNDAIRLTLLRGSSGPDRCPEQGIHRIRFSLGFVRDTEEAFRHSALFCNPAVDLSGTPGHPGTLPPEQGMLRVNGAEVSAVKPSEKGDADIVLRLFEPVGNPAEAETIFPQEIAEAWLTDFHENRVENTASQAGLQWQGKKLWLQIEPHRTVTLAVRYCRG